MLRVLIVDDDKLTRKGLISFMPWDEYSMEIIGEACNGIEALKFLENNQVDLVLTDLDMPLMSGMDFIRTAIPLYPQLYFVVLTIHNDFCYIQDALRLGAIDYIAKVQLDKENFSAVLERIKNRISSDIKDNYSMVDNWEKRIFYQDSVYVFMTMDDDSEYISLFDNLGYTTTRAGGGVCFCFEEQVEIEKFDEFLGGDWMFIKLLDVLGMKYIDVYFEIMKYRKSSMFYEYNVSRRLITHHISELNQYDKELSDADFNLLKTSWLSMNWVKDSSVFDKIRIDLKDSHLTPSKLLHIVLAIENAWNNSYSDTLKQRVSVPPSFHSWAAIEEWLFSVYEKTNFLKESFQFSPEVMDGILTAKQIINSEYSNRIHSDDIARRVNMSRSYFSQCFSKIIGISFSDYLRNCRIEKSQEYLADTTYSVQTIAEKIGYIDEKYFSRIFKKTTGILPSEYRKIERKQNLTPNI